MKKKIKKKVTSTPIELGGSNFLKGSAKEYWRDHYSHSQADSNCGRKLWYRYLDPRKIPSPSNVHMMVGNAVEAGVNHLLRKRMGAGMEGITCVMAINEQMKKEEDKWKKNGWEIDQEVFEELWKETPKILEVVEKYESLIDYQPVEMQKKLWIELPDLDLPVEGYIDIVAQRTGPFGPEPVIIDIKSSAKKKAVTNGWKMQLALYALGIQRETTANVLPTVEIHLLVRLKTRTDIYIEKLQLEASDYAQAYMRLKDLQWRIDKGYFPANREGWWCSPKWCNYYDTCHSEYGAEDNTLLGLNL